MKRPFLYIACALLAFSITASETAMADDELEHGRRIYQEGILSSGAPLTGIRFDKVTVSGREAACANCHRRSGMGSVEGDIQIPPITGSFLFAKKADKAVATMDLRSRKRMNQTHEPYTDESLVAAISRGMSVNGREMSVMMPRYDLNDTDMKALVAYLRQLSTQWSPGVTDDTIRFATVITPGVDPERRKVLLDMLNAAIAQKNGSTVTGKRNGGRRHMVTAAEMILGTERNWQLDVWELKGTPETWKEQLEAYYSQRPVFALISGLSSTTWKPVHDFCQSRQVPCWFPSVVLPETEEAFYPVYFSRGVSLEADVLARYLRSKRDRQPRRLVQVYMDGHAGRGAAEAMSQALKDSGISLEDRIIGVNQGDLKSALADITGDDAVMLWLGPKDIPELEKAGPPAADIFFSASLARESEQLPSAWKGGAHLVYPYELPDRRQGNMANFYSWLRIRNIPLIDDPLQAEIYFALDFITETLSEMLNNLYRDYLIERAENMLSVRESRKAKELAKQQVSLGKGGIRAGSHDSTTIYPRMGLGSGQRFASKGGYIVRFAGADSNRLIAESEWIVP